MKTKSEAKAMAAAKAARREKFVKKSADEMTKKARMKWLLARRHGQSPMDKLPIEIRRKIYQYTLPSKSKIFKPIQKKRNVPKANHAAVRRAASAGSYSTDYAAYINREFAPDSEDVIYISKATGREVNAVTADANTARSVLSRIVSTGAIGNKIGNGGKTGNGGNNDSMDNTFKSNNIGNQGNITGFQLPASISNPNLLKDLASFSANIMNVNDNSNNFSLSTDTKVVTFCKTGITKRPLNPNNMFLPLLTTNKKICAEVSAIFYEEYTFELHIHADGIDFLDLPRLNILDNYGLGLIDNVLCKEKQFKDVGVFSFRRIKHWRIVLFGGDPADRTAGMRMRQIMALLVELFGKEEKPLTSVEVVFALEKPDMDKIGTFWIIKDTKVGRRSIWNEVTNIELITSPLLSLRNVLGGVALSLPVDITDAKDIAYKHAFEHTLAQPADYVGVGQFKSVVDKAMMDACMDYCLQKGEYPVDSPKAADIPLLTEADILADAADSEFEDFDEADYEDEE